MKTRKLREVIKTTKKAYLVRLWNNEVRWVPKSIGFVENYPSTGELRLVMQDWAVNYMSKYEGVTY